VLPAELGDEGRERAVAAFERWSDGLEPVAELAHPYLVPETRYSGPDPRPGWAAQLEGLEKECRVRFDKDLRDLDVAGRRAQLAGPVGQAGPGLGSPSNAHHIAVALMAHFYRSPTATDLCYGRVIAKQQCRGLEGALGEPVQVAWVRTAHLLAEAGLSGHARQNLSVKVEIDIRPPAGAAIQRTLVTRHFTFVVSHYDLPSLFAGKLHALLTRGYPKGRDWTVTAFLTSSNGPDLDIATDRGTAAALHGTLDHVATTPVSQLRGHRLDATDFNRMAGVDVFRDILRWMGDPERMRSGPDENRWNAFRAECRSELRFDPGTEPDVSAGARLGGRTGPWAKMWARFAEAPDAFPGAPEVLARSRPAGELALDREQWPDLNDEDEEAVRSALADLPGLSHADALRAVARLEGDHGHRRRWVWARLGRSPLAEVLKPLARPAEIADKAIGGASPGDVAEVYAERGWLADAGAREALSLAPAEHGETVSAAVCHLLEPWLDDSARAFQSAVDGQPLPSAGGQPAVSVGEDECIVFVNGLRYELGRSLAARPTVGVSASEIRRYRARGASLKYWDSSALVALVVDEPRSAELRATIRRDPVIVTWWGSRIECASALNRLERDNRFESAGFDRSLDQLGLLAASWIEIGPLDRVRRRAIRLLRLHRLPATDALQLAAALIASGEDPQRLDLVSIDDRLSAAARREGFRVL